MRAFNEYLDSKTVLVEQGALERLKEIGEVALEEAVESGSYTDVTGNLRSSIYYAVIKDGEIIYIDGGEQVLGGSAGVQIGRSMVNKIAAMTVGIALIVVAGMEYAVHVETRKNVLSSAELIAERLVADLAKKLGNK